MTYTLMNHIHVPKRQGANEAVAGIIVILSVVQDKKGERRGHFLAGERGRERIFCDYVAYIIHTVDDSAARRWTLRMHKLAGQIS